MGFLFCETDKDVSNPDGFSIIEDELIPQKKK